MSKSRRADFFLASTFRRRARSIVAILSARTKVSDFQNNFFMFILRLEDKISKCFFFVSGNENAASRVLGFGATMKADAAALWDVLHDRQQSFEFWGVGDGYVVAER